MKQNSLPIAVTMGDPAGIGPEIIAKAWTARKTRALPCFFVLGCLNTLKHMNFYLPLKAIDAPHHAFECFDTHLPVIDIATPSPVIWGEPNGQNAAMVLEAIEMAVNFVKNNQVKAIVTAPINKATLYEAGFEFKGHTDFLAHLMDKKEDDAVMFFYSPKLCVVPLTIHLPLSQVAKKITKPAIIKTSKIILDALENRFGLNNPRLAITGLNPHAGEDGHMGDEEVNIINPAIKELQEQGFGVFGSFAADSLFCEAERTKYDAILAMYHDQALGPLKALDMRKAVNVTLGLDPLIRTSPDHGTAFAIAGHNQADPESMIQSILLAERLAAGRKVENE